MLFGLLNLENKEGTWTINAKATKTGLYTVAQVY